MVTVPGICRHTCDMSVSNPSQLSLLTCCDAAAPTHRVVQFWQSWTIPSPPDTSVSEPLLLQLSYHHYYKEAFTVDYLDWLFCHDLSHLLKITTGHSEVSESRLWQVRFIGTRDIISQLTPLYYMYILNWKKNQWIPNKCTCLVHFPSFFALCLITNVLQNHSLLQPQQRQPRVVAEYFITTSVHVYIVLKKTG